MPRAICPTGTRKNESSGHTFDQVCYRPAQRTPVYNTAFFFRARGCTWERSCFFFRNRITEPTQKLSSASAGVIIIVVPEQSSDSLSKNFLGRPIVINS